MRILWYAHDIGISKTEIPEIDLQLYLGDNNIHSLTMQMLTVKCTTCSAETTFPEGITAGSCAFCGNNIVVANANMQTVLKPQALLPFKVEKTKAQADFQSWLQGLWWAPNDLAKYARQEEKLVGIYLPFWIYSTQVHIFYTGERGEGSSWSLSTVEHERRGEEYLREEDEAGTPTKYYSVSGNIDRYYDNVVVVASTSLPTKLQDDLEPWDLEQLVQFDERFISGFSAQSYHINVRDGWHAAQVKLQPTIENSIYSDIGGENQKINSKSVTYSQSAVKQVLLPVWISSYQYKGKIYRFMINGRTGDVQGSQPYSTAKIVLAVILGLVLLLGLFFLLKNGRFEMTS